MPLPKPTSDEEKDAFISRCTSAVLDKEEADNFDQAVAICNSIWDRRNNMRGFHAIHFLQDAGEIRVERFNGKEHVVVPAVALVEGVLFGANSTGPELALASEFGKFPDSWNGRPVTLGHPMRDDSFVSASSMPDVFEDESVGTVFSSKVEGDALKVEFWLEKGKMPEGELERLQSGETVEVSTGFFAEAIPAQGNFKGREFSAVMVNIVPDHIAILEEGTIGACSVEAGCGVPRINEIRNNSLKTDSLSNNCDGNCGCKECERKLLDNGDIENENAKDGGGKRNFLAELAERIFHREEQMPKKTEEELKVERELEAKKALVAKVIANAATPFDDEDEEVLSGMSDEKLEALADMKEDSGEADGGADDTAAFDAEGDKDLETFSESETYEQLPEHVRSFLDRKMEEEKAEKASLASRVFKAEVAPFSEDELKDMEIGVLRKWAKQIDKNVGGEDYSGRGGPNANSAGADDEIPTPTKIFERKGAA